jgi:hypothetical protein
VGRNQRLKKISVFSIGCCGRGGIRTHGTLAGTPVFKTGALNHSATLPNQQYQRVDGIGARTSWQRFANLDPTWTQIAF